MKKITTVKDFELFKKECEYWIDYFGLKGWFISYEHSQREPNNAATIYYKTEARDVIIILTKKWDDFDIQKIEPEIKKIAFHEVCHLLLANLSVMAHDEATNLQKSEIRGYEHEIIAVLEKTIYNNA